MPWVEKRGSGYRLVVDIGEDSLGKRNRKTKMVDTTSKRQAEKELSRFVVELEEKGFFSINKPKKIIFDQMLDKWVEIFVLNDLELTTQSNYLYQLKTRIRPELGQMPLDKITSLTIVEFLHNMKSIRNPGQPVGAQTKLYVYRMLKSIFLKATEWYNLSFNPMEKVARPKDDKPPGVNVYDETESKEVFKHLQSEPTQFRVLITLAFTSGMRRAELLGLEWKHINKDRGVIELRQSIPAFKDGVPVIKAPKNKGSVRTISIPPSVIAELEEYKKEWFKLRTKNIEIWKTNHEFIFCNKYGMPYYPKTLGEKWRSFIQRKNLRHIRMHDIRHTSVTILINRGIHAKIISERIGHSKIGTTMDVYGHVIRAADVAAADTFETVFSTPAILPLSDAEEGGKKGGN
ncbi:integrase [Paenibacillus anaericanus]|uniref:tyrosine-type recombinase/integrase n=1 Tax=Paenibacillus anaericanus TaxID=170367 RepID=UPI002781D76A|nr:site-specific integrase [Paenibacillus anaericanus]MDQ0091616.1 integrase [Paenibacillus anaericanus]